MISFYGGLTASIVVLTLFIGVGSHAARPAALDEALRAHDVLGPRLRRFAAAVVPFVEGALGVGGATALLTGHQRGLQAVLAVGTALFGLYAGYTRHVLALGRGGPCGCSHQDVPLSRWVTRRAVALAGLALAGASPGRGRARSALRGGVDHTAARGSCLRRAAVVPARRHARAGQGRRAPDCRRSVDAMDFTTSAVIASWAAIALLALVVSGLIRQVHQLSRTQQHHPGRVGIAPGASAPGLDPAALDGLLTPGRAALLLFLDADCRTCADVLAEARAWTVRQDAAAPQVLGFYAGAGPQAEEGAVPVRDHRPELFTAYDIPATPYAVAIDPEGRIARSEPLGSPTALLRLLDDIQPATPRSLP